MIGKSVIVIRRETSPYFGALRSFLVRIDGRRAGKVKPGGTGEFQVEPGERTVQVWMDWARSTPLTVLAEPGGKVELEIRPSGVTTGWMKTVLPIITAVLAARPLREVLQAAMGLTGWTWWALVGLDLGVMFVLVAVYILATSTLSSRYWAMWSLQRVDGGR